MILGFHLQLFAVLCLVYRWDFVHLLFQGISRASNVMPIVKDLQQNVQVSRKIYLVS